MSDALRRLARLVSDRTGIRVEPEQHRWFAAAVDRLALGDGRPLSAEHAAVLGEDGDFVERLIDEVTVRETFFLREHEQLRSVDWAAMRARADAAGRALRVWSAGCSSGEEPYTLAMLARDALGPAAPVSVLGTDISRAALARARAGWYEGRTVKRLAGDPLGRHFRPRAGGLSVDPAIQEMVRFHRHNLTRDPSPPLGEDAFDLVVCRNVLIHLEADAAARVGERLTAALQPHGTLVLAPADRLCLTGPSLRAVLRGAGPQAGDSAAARVGQSDASRRSGGRLGDGPAGRPRMGRAPERTRSPTPPRAADGSARARRLAAEVSEAVRLADTGRLDAALEVAYGAASRDPMDVSAHLLTGVLQLAVGSPERAVVALRRALYLDPGLAIAAFHLGRARDEMGDRVGAEQAYQTALHALDPEDRRYDGLVDPFSLRDVAEACRLRLLDLRSR